VNTQVLTPSGKRAIVVDVDERAGEATIEWADGERARFRIRLLRRAPTEHA
jgi:hypothetical protein